MTPIQIFVLVVMIIGIIIVGAFIVIWTVTTKKNNEDPNIQEASSDFINVIDIRDGEILTKDGTVISIFRITPVNIHLMTAAEKKEHIQKLSGYLSSVKSPYKLLCLPRPFDVQPYISALEAQKSKATDIQSRIINEEIYSLNSIAKSGTIIEKNYYLVVWDEPEEISKTRSDIYKCWTDGGVQLTLLDKKELVRLCNLVFNPSFTGGDEEFEMTFPTLKGE